MSRESTSSPKPKVLVIEDSAETRRLIEMGLGYAGFEVEHAVDGLGGLEAATVAIPDVIVLDIGLPGLGGWEVLERLRSDPRTAQIPVLVCTAHDTPGSREQADQSAANDFLGKPFDLNDLRDAVRRLAMPVVSSA